MVSIRSSVSVGAIVTAAFLFSGCRSINNLGQSTQTETVWRQTGNVYSNLVVYESPGGREQNTFTLTLVNGMITDVGVTITTGVDASISYQRGFAAEIPGLVVGKKLADLPRFDRVSGASLTTAAFDQAVANLKKQVGS